MINEYTYKLYQHVWRGIPVFPKAGAGTYFEISVVDQIDALDQKLKLCCEDPYAKELQHLSNICLFFIFLQYPVIKSNSRP